MCDPLAIVLDIGGKAVLKYGLRRLRELVGIWKQSNQEEEKKRKEEEKKRRQEEETQKRFMGREMDPKEENGLSFDQLENYLQRGSSRAGYLMGLRCYNKRDLGNALTYFIRGYNLDQDMLCTFYIAIIQIEEKEFSKALPFLEECRVKLESFYHEQWVIFAPFVCDAIWTCHVNIGGEEHIRAAIPLLESSARCGVLEARMELAAIFAADGEFNDSEKALALYLEIVPQVKSSHKFSKFQMRIGQLILKLDRDPLEAIQHLGLAMNGGDETNNGNACFLTVIAYRRLKEHAHKMKESCRSHRKRRQWKKEERHDRDMEKHFMRMGASCGNTKCMATSVNPRDLLAAAQRDDFQAMFRYGHLIRKTKPREGARFIKQALQNYQPTEADEEFVRNLASDDESDSDSDSESDNESESESDSESESPPKKKPKRASASDSDSEPKSDPKGKSKESDS